MKINMKMKMRKRKIILTALFLCLLLVSPAKAFAAGEEKKELKIYAMYLDTQAKGDSVLLESKGEYLLLDMGTAEHSDGLVRQLKSLGVTHLSVMFSHLHSDHIGASTYNITAGLEKLKANGIQIDTMYLPARENAPFSMNFPYRYTALENFMRMQGSGEMVYLKAGDTLAFGDVTGDVIGPLKTNEMSPAQFMEISMEPHVLYENNTSLAVIFTCGNTRYFTAGDNYETQTDYLVEQYGDSLKCDIMKLCHHGNGSGNSAKLLKAIKPKYSFALNTGFTGKTEKSGRWRIYTSLKRASKYGMCYLVGHEKETLIYQIVDDKITLYRGNTVATGKKMTGWQWLYGADGVNRERDMYYLNDNCAYVKGVKKIGKNTYCFRQGGQMDYGEYGEDNTYLGWKSYTGGNRYYTLSKDGKYAYMNTGFHEIDDAYLYFKDNGYQMVNDDEVIGIKKIGSSFYAMDIGGSITVNNWEEFNGKRYYFDDKGKMVQNKIVKIDSDKYYFDGKGVMQKNKAVKIGGKSYCFDKYGRMVSNRKIKLGGKRYSCDKNGVATVIKKKK